MRILLAAILVAALGWSAYWWVGARAVDREIVTWLDQRHQSGWVANYSDLETAGFPNRFDTTLTDLELVDPTTGVAWTAPFFQIFRLSYTPTHVIAVWPKTQLVATPNQKITINAEDARASLVFEDASEWGLDRSNFSGQVISFQSDKGWTADVGSVALATRASERVEGAVDVGLNATTIRPASPALGQLADMGIVPGSLDHIQIDASISFDAPWDRNAVEVGRPNITAIDLHVLKSQWGKLDLWAAGTLTIDATGRPTGSITVKAKNWREMLQLAQATDWLPESLVAPLESGLGLLATLSGSKETLDAPLTFRDGQISFGPIPLGPAPVFRMR